MEKFWKILLLSLLTTSSSACRSEVATVAPDDVAVSALMSDGVAFGSISVSSGAGDAPGFMSGHLHVSSNVSEDVSFENIPGDSLKECEGKKCVVLYYSTPSGKVLTQAPRPALFRDEAVYREFNSIMSASKNKVTSLLSKEHCSAQMRSLLDRLDGEDQQASIDALFSHALPKEERLCLASQISSLAKLKKGSFVPPYPSSEGVYHHGFPTRGDLIAFLLPHLTKTAILPSTFPLSAEDRQRLTSTWMYAMSAFDD